MGLKPRLATVTVKRCGFALLTFRDHAMADGRLDHAERVVEDALRDAYLQAKATDSADALADAARRGIATLAYRQALIDQWQADLDECPEPIPA